MSSVILNLPDEESTIELGKRIANLIQNSSVLILEGELGAGKTTLCRGIIIGLGGNPEQVTSPTFTIVNEYETEKFSVRHCDFTRLPKGDLLDDFGGMEFFAEPCVYVVEWFSQIGLPEKAFKNRILRVSISYTDSGRSVRIEGPTAKDLQFLK